MFLKTDNVEHSCFCNQTAAAHEALKGDLSQKYTIQEYLGSDDDHIKNKNLKYYKISVYTVKIFQNLKQVIFCIFIFIFIDFACTKKCT